MAKEAAMPAHKRASSDNLLDEEVNLQQHHRRKQPRREPRQRQARAIEEDDDTRLVDDEDSDGILPEELPEYTSISGVWIYEHLFFYIDLMEVRKDAQCPICLGIIKKTRTVMECMHRFCRECIDKAMRLGNNECPACRAHCASRRSLRDDPKFDEMIDFFFPNINKYEEEEMAFVEEDRTRNKQIQDSITQIYERQSEALNKRRPTPKETASTLTVRLPCSQRYAYPRRRRGAEIEESEENEDENDQDGNRDSSSSDERGPEVEPRRYNRRSGARYSRPSSSLAANASATCIYNEREKSTERRSTSPGAGILWKAEGLTWGRGGTRSHTRYGGASGIKDPRTRECKLVDYLHGLKENDDEFNVHLDLIPVDKERTPGLSRLHLCCPSSSSVKHLCEYVAYKTSLKPEKVEMLLVVPIDLNEKPQTIKTSDRFEDLNSLSRALDGSKLGLERLVGQESLAGLKDGSSNNIIITYIEKKGN